MVIRPSTVSVFISLALVQGGCAATWAAAHWQEVPIGNGFQTAVTPIGEQQHRAEIEARPHDPAPDEVVYPDQPEPEPVPEPAPPPPPAPPPQPEPEDELVGPPYGTSPLRFICAQEQRASQERLERRWAIWDIGEKLVMGLVGLFEVVVAGAMIHEASDGEFEQPVGAYAVAAVLASDALGLFALMALTEPTWQSHSSEQPGRWRQAGGGCPAGLHVVVGEEALPIDASGQLDPNHEAWLVRELVLRGDALELRLDGESVALRVDDSTRCRWAHDRRLMAPPACDPEAPSVPQRVTVSLDQPRGSGEDAHRR